MRSQTLFQGAPRAVHRPVQLVLVRANAPLFYSITAASLLEVGMPLAADRLLHFFGADSAFAHWTRTEWLPRKIERAKQIREYIETIWPEYDWSAGHEHYRGWIEERGTGPYRPTAAHEALARCVASAQSGVFYRSLSRWAEDRRLRELARVIAQEEALSFTHFRNLYDRQLRAQGFGCASAWSTALACVRTARDQQVPRAFTAINAQCAGHVPFPVLDYREFVVRMGSVIERHGDLATPERVLLRTWKRGARVCADQPPPKKPGWFKPALQRSA